MAKKGSKHAPEHLEIAGKRLWRCVTDSFELEEHHFVILELACASLDRAERCRVAITAEGETVRDRWGQVKSHPLLPAERDARSSFLRALHELSLDVVALPGTIGRPPSGGR